MRLQEPKRHSFPTPAFPLYFHVPSYFFLLSKPSSSIFSSTSRELNVTFHDLLKLPTLLIQCSRKTEKYSQYANAMRREINIVTKANHLLLSLYLGTKALCIKFLQCDLNSSSFSGFTRNPHAIRGRPKEFSIPGFTNRFE